MTEHKKKKTTTTRKKKTAVSKRKRKVDVDKLTKEQLEELERTLSKKILDVTSKAVQEVNAFLKTYNLQAKMQMQLEPISDDNTVDANKS